MRTNFTTDAFAHFVRSASTLPLQGRGRTTPLALRVRREAAGEAGELADEVLQEILLIVGDRALRVDEVGFERNIGFAAGDMKTEVAEHGAQMLPWATAATAPPDVPMMAAGLPGQEKVRPAPGPRAPVDGGVLQHGGNRAVVLGDEQQGVGTAKFRLEAVAGAWNPAAVVLVVHLQVVDLDELGLEGIDPSSASAWASLPVD